MSTEDKKRKKSAETLRERAEKATTAKPKTRRIRKTASVAAKPFKAARRIGQKEYYLPLPQNRVGKFLNTRRRFTPRYFRNAWAELRQVKWPTKKETWKLTVAVFLFALIFGIVVAITDYGLDKLFRSIIL